MCYHGVRYCDAWYALVLLLLLLLLLLLCCRRHLRLCWPCKGGQLRYDCALRGGAGGIALRGRKRLWHGELLQRSARGAVQFWVARVQRDQTCEHPTQALSQLGAGLLRDLQEGWQELVERSAL